MLSCTNDVIYLVYQFYCLSMSQSQDIDDYANNIIIVIVHQQNRRVLLYLFFILDNLINDFYQGYRQATTCSLLL